MAIHKGKRVGSHAEAAYTVLLAVVAGVLLWYAMRLGQYAAAPLLGKLPAVASLAFNAGIEEALRVGLALTAAFMIRVLRLRPGLAILGVLASITMAAFENASYMERFPTLDIYWRLGYAVPIHAGAAALYALATQTLMGGKPRRAAVVGVAFLTAWMWHSAFNIAAALSPSPSLPLVGTALNLCALAALAAATVIRYGHRSIH